MDTALGAVAVAWLIHEERQLARQHFGLGRKRSNRDQRPCEAACHLSQHQRIGGALQSHHWKTPLAAGADSRVQLAGCFFETAFHCSARSLKCKTAPRRIAAWRRRPGYSPIIADVPLTIGTARQDLRKIYDRLMRRGFALR